MDAKEIKKYIHKNNLLQTLLENVGCHSFTPYDKELRCALPGETDNSKVSISYDDNLSVRIFTKGETVYGSIFDLIMHIDQSNFKDACRKCASLLGLSTRMSMQKRNDPLDFFKKIDKKRKNRANTFEEYDLSILDKYEHTPHIDLIRKDGIFGDVVKKYSIVFDQRTDRIIFPHFKYDDKNKIVGLIGRTVQPAFKELNIPKYFSMEGIKYEKSRNLYGLSHNIENIKKTGEIIIFEAEKSVLKADMMGFPNGVSVGCHDISDFQKKLIISLNVEIIIAFDVGIDTDHIEKICSELNKYRKVSYIIDDWKLLKDGDSPVDRGLKKWQFLYRHRKTIKEVM